MILYATIGLFIWCSVGAFIGGMVVTEMEKENVQNNMDPVQHIAYWTFLWVFLLISMLGSIFYQLVLEHSKKG